MDRIITAIRNNWKDTANWLAYTLIGGLIPVWGGMVAFVLLSKPVLFSSFSSNGEFAIYSAAMLAPSLYLIAKDRTTSNFLFRPFFSLMCIVGLLLSTILFAIVTAVNTGGLGTVSLNVGFLRVFTLLLFAGSVLLSFVVTSVDAERIGIDIDQVRKKKKEQITDLNDEVDKLLGGGK